MPLIVGAGFLINTMQKIHNVQPSYKRINYLKNFLYFRIISYITILGSDKLLILCS